MRRVYIIQVSHKDPAINSVQYLSDIFSDTKLEAASIGAAKCYEDQGGAEYIAKQYGDLAPQLTFQVKAANLRIELNAE